MPGPPDDVADRVVDREPDRARDEEPDRDVDRPDRPQRDGGEDVDDAREPDHEQRDVDRPDELAVLAALAVTRQQADDPEQEHQVPRPGAPHAQALAPHPAGADQAREHVEERAEVHHRQPREDDAAHVRRPDPAEAEPRDAAEGLRRHELRGEDEAEEVDDGQPEDRREEPVARGAIREWERPLGPAGQWSRRPEYLCARACRPSRTSRAREHMTVFAAEAVDDRTVIRSHASSVMSPLGYGRGSAHPGDRG